MSLWRLRVTIDDRPGFLSLLTASLALRSVNILSVQVLATEDGAVDDFLVDAPDTMTADDLIVAIERGRGRDPWVCRADTHHLADEPVRALTLAARVIADPHALDQALARLLGECSVTVETHPGLMREDFTPTHICFPHPCGGTLVVYRPFPAFTPTEYARACALVELAATAVRREQPTG